MYIYISKRYTVNESITPVAICQAASVWQSSFNPF